MLQSFYLGQKIVGTDYDIDTLKEKISKITMEDAARVFKNVKLETVYFLTGKEDAYWNCSTEKMTKQVRNCITQHILQDSEYI